MLHASATKPFEKHDLCNTLVLNLTAFSLQSKQPLVNQRLPGMGELVPMTEFVGNLSRSLSNSVSEYDFGTSE